MANSTEKKELKKCHSQAVRSTRARSETRRVRENFGRLGFLVFYAKRPFWV